MTQKMNQAVADTYAAFPKEIRQKLLTIREKIFAVAAMTEGVGAIKETLKWGDPAYLTNETKSGSTIRLGWKKAAPDQYAMYFNCQTTLIDTFRTIFPSTFRYEGNRAILFQLNDRVDMEAVGVCIHAALTYHLNKK